jgi:hypothetical protein
MAYIKIDINSQDWTLIGDNINEITFQNVSQFGVYINFTAANTAPIDEVGLVYGPWQGELKKTLTDMTSVATPAYVWAKAISKSGRVIVEE